MLSRTDKLGAWIFAWSIPALLTCPGASILCKLICYALTGRYRMSNVKNAHKRNLLIAKSPKFASLMNHWLRSRHVIVLRIHASGDFFGKRYIKAWIKIVRHCPGVRFYAYTRSWDVPELLPLLVELGREPNFEMWFSWDRTMSFPPRRKGFRTCYLSESDEDLPGRKTDLIFRDSKKTVMKKDRLGNQVCPYDNGVTKTTCSHCKLCWTSKEKNPVVPLVNLLEQRKETYARNI